MKRKIITILQLITISLVLVACTGNVENSSSDSEVAVTENMETQVSVVPEAEKEEEVISQVEPGKENIVHYTGEQFAKSVFCAAQDIIYIVGQREDKSFFLGCMEADSNELRVLDVEIPEDMRAFEMCIDENGDVHILLMSVKEIALDNDYVTEMTFEKSYIWVVDREGNVYKEIDVSDIFASECVRPFCFVVDENGNYYIEKRAEILKINEAGTIATRIACDGEVVSMGFGKSGSLYCNYMNEDGKEYLGKLEQDTFAACDIILPEAQASYGYIVQGTDSELILYNRENGLYTYDEATNNIELIMGADKMPIFGEDISGYGVLRDVRICLMTQKNNETIFYYVPIM